eukprot:130164-Pyramimonas_sp.AAC.1
MDRSARLAACSRLLKPRPFRPFPCLRNAQGPPVARVFPAGLGRAAQGTGGVVRAVGQSVPPA